MLTFPYYNSIEGFYFFTYLKVLYLLLNLNDDIHHTIASQKIREDDKSLGTISL